MVIREQIKLLNKQKLKNNELFGSLLSPMFNLKSSETFCISVQTKLERGGIGAIFRVGIRFESDPLPVWLYRKSLQRFYPQGEWLRLSWQLKRKLINKRGFQLIFDISKQNEAEQIKFFFSLDNLFIRSSDCPNELEPYFGAAPDEETEANLLIPIENLIDTDPRVYRTAGLDGLPAVGIKRGVEIVVPYRIYLPRKFYRNFAILASIRPNDNLGGFLFAVLNAFDTIVELGVKLQPSGPTQTNISLFYTDSLINSIEQRNSKVLASFLVPVFTGQWTQFALEIHEQTVGLYFRCMRYAVRQVYRHPTQLQMDDASKLYIANAGPIIGGGFEGAIQELKLHDDFAEAANQCNENWDVEKVGLLNSGFGSPEENDLKMEEEEREMEKEKDNLEGGPTKYLPKNINLLTTAQKEEEEETILTTTKTYSLPQTKQTIQQLIQGPKGEPGIPGVCSSECTSRIIPPPGPPGLPGVFPGLTEEDLNRIASWPGVKGEKGDRGECCGDNNKQLLNNYKEEENENQVILLNNQNINELPAYNKKLHGNEQKQQILIKGEKGERGERGQPGLPGKLIEKQSSTTFSGIKIFQTTLELLSATQTYSVGTLAFTISTQQLFIRVYAGWKQIILGETLFNAGIKERNIDEQISLPSVTVNNNLLSEQRWQSRWPPKENRLFEEEEEKQKNELINNNLQQKRHKDKIIHLIALNKPLNGNFGGVRGADLECYRQARQFGFTTTFRAFLSSRVQDLNKIVNLDDRNYTPIVNINGERLFNSWNSIFDGERIVHSHVPIYSFNKKDVNNNSIWPNNWLWHGSTSEGLRTSKAFCEDWRSNNSKSFGNASPLYSYQNSLTGQSKEINCNNQFIVLCIEVMSKYNVNSKLGKRFLADDVIFN